MNDDFRHDPLFHQACSVAWTNLWFARLEAGPWLLALLRFRETALRFILESALLVPWTEAEEHWIGRIATELQLKKHPPLEPDGRDLQPRPEQDNERGVVAAAVARFTRILTDGQASDVRAGIELSPLGISLMRSNVEAVATAFKTFREAFRAFNQAARSNEPTMPGDRRKKASTQARAGLIRGLKNPSDLGFEAPPYSDNQIARIFDTLGIESLDTEDKVSKFRSEHRIKASTAARPAMRLIPGISNPEK